MLTLSHSEWMRSERDMIVRRRGGKPWNIYSMVSLGAFLLRGSRSQGSGLTVVLMSLLVAPTMTAPLCKYSPAESLPIMSIRIIWHGFGIHHAAGVVLAAVAAGVGAWPHV